MAGQVVLSRVRLVNFISHSDTVVDLVPGVNVFIGPNGAGKTSILEAIHYALTGEGWRAGGKRRRSLLRSGASGGHVELVFRIGGASYMVRRPIGGAAMLMEIRDGKPVAIARDDREVTAKLRELIGVDLSILSHVALIRQGGITYVFSEARPKERKQAIDSIIGLEKYREAGEKLGRYHVKISIPGLAIAEPLAPSLQPGRDPSTVIPRLVERIRTAYTAKLREIEEKRKRLMDARREKEEIEREIEEKKLRDKAARYDELSRKIGSVTATISHIGAEIEKLAKETRELERIIDDRGRALEKLSREIEEASRKAAATGRLQEILTGLSEALARLEAVEAAIKPLRDTVDRQAAAVKRLEELRRQGVPPASSVEEERNSIRDKLAALEEKLNTLHAELARADEAAKAAARELGKARREIEAVLSRVKRYGVEASDPLRVATAMREAVERMRGEKEAVENRLRELEAEKERLTQEIRENEEKIRLLTTTREPRCPLCGSPLTPEHRDEIVGMLREKNRRAEERIRVIEEELRALRDRVKMLEEAISEMSEAAIRSVEEKAETMEKMRREQEKNAEKARELQRQIEAVRDEKNKLYERLRDVERLLKKARELDTLEKTVDPEEYREKKRELEKLIQDKTGIEKTMEKLVEEAAGYIGAAATDPHSLLEALEKALEEAREAEKRLEALRTRRDTLLRELEEKRRELEEGKRELEEKRGVLQKLIAEKNRLEKELREAEEARERLRELEERLTELRGEIKRLEDEIEEKRGELEKIKREAEEANKAIRKLYVAWWLRRYIYHQDGLPKLLRRRIVRLLAARIEKLLERFNIEYQRVEVDEEYTITLHGYNKKLELPMLSGGEKVVVSLAAILALYQLVSRGRLGFLALDEPTEYLDTDRRTELVNILQEFQGGKIIPQLLIITHDETLKEAGDRIYRVTKENGVSRIERLV